MLGEVIDPVCKEGNLRLSGTSFFFFLGESVLGE
jgi:hypothetical protein